MSDARWIELDGAANVRDLAGAPTLDGRAVRPGRLIRADNLQDLSERDVRALVDDHNVRAVADLRTGVEVRSEGPGPLTDIDDVEIRNLSLFRESGEATDVAADGPVVLPWQDRDRQRSEQNRTLGASGIYLLYLDERADSVIDALRLIARSPGATIVHCAAGKDRTGVVVALALAEVGVTREAIVADYARSAERIDGIFDRLKASPTYRGDIGDDGADKHAPRADTMDRLLDALDESHGCASAWLREHGWTDEDAAALRRKLLD
ncbi:MAG: tyrosine-protein phosphatase [Jatrophihabitantaceae bacterium]